MTKRRSFWLWFGVLGAPAAWAVQLVANYSLEEWFACSPATTSQGEILGRSVPATALLITIALTLVALASAVVSVSLYRRLPETDGEGAVRVKWMALAGVMNGVLYLILVVASFGPPLLLEVCETSP